MHREPLSRSHNERAHAHLDYRQPAVKRSQSTHVRAAAMLQLPVEPVSYTHLRAHETSAHL
eukprot:6615451-Alexandrium_andersonii.AAC.1